MELFIVARSAEVAAFQVGPSCGKAGEGVDHHSRLEQFPELPRPNHVLRSVQSYPDGVAAGPQDG